MIGYHFQLVEWEIYIILIYFTMN